MTPVHTLAHAYLPLQITAQQDRMHKAKWIVTVRIADQFAEERIAHDEDHAKQIVNYMYDKWFDILRPVFNAGHKLALERSASDH